MLDVCFDEKVGVEGHLLSTQERQRVRGDNGRYGLWKGEDTATSRRRRERSYGRERSK